MYGHPRAVWVYPRSESMKRAIAFIGGGALGLTVGLAAFLLGVHHG